MELEGTTLGHYLLQRRLARGGMSEVYLAYDQSIQRTVAIKVVNRYRDDHIQTTTMPAAEATTGMITCSESKTK